MAQHPTLNTLTRAMGTFGSASRGVLSITTALSTTILALNSAGREVNALNSELQEAKRQQALALSRYGFESEEYAEATERVNELTAKIKEFNAQTTVSNINNVLNYAAAIGILGGNIASAIKAGTLGIGTLTLALSGLIAIPAGIAKAFSDIGSIASIFDMIMGTNFFNWMQKSMDQLFAGQIPDILKFAGQAFEKLFTVIIPDAFIGLINWWNKGNETLVNIFINAINDIIKKANTIASAIGLPKIKTMALYTAPQIALGSPAGTRQHD